MKRAWVPFPRSGRTEQNQPHDRRTSRTFAMLRSRSTASASCDRSRTRMSRDIAAVFLARVGARHGADDIDVHRRQHGRDVAQQSLPVVPVDVNVLDRFPRRFRRRRQQRKLPLVQPLSGDQAHQIDHLALAHAQRAPQGVFRRIPRLRRERGRLRRQVETAQGVDEQGAARRGVGVGDMLAEPGLYLHPRARRPDETERRVQPLASRPLRLAGDDVDVLAGPQAAYPTAPGRHPPPRRRIGGRLRYARDRRNRPASRLRVRSSTCPCGVAT